MKKYYKYLPKFYFNSIFQIPYDFFFQKGIKAILLDLDNTLLKYNENQINPKIKKILYKIKKKFFLVIISNASKGKLKKILYPDFDYIYLKFYQKKPCVKGFLKALDLFNVSYDQAIMIGDQLTTDIQGANKINIISVLIKPLDPSKESFWTKLNRFFIEKPFIKKIKKIDPQLYKKKFQHFLEI
ncbi:YqeG family HAD IIIA-type phosphatase [Candidatus Phytoplasma pini]|uniref:Putative hydrolase n=1 Tax=Candidatus Phytoplasma pini TaxID=267362 RepID=A0A559KJA8_9MOLU|nr:HAD-IIIA family hydrolase [Candidatus Phytoplasma pini]TVY12199.1 putative hydrolase [Candidatus Phytoplasma pini]